MIVTRDKFEGVLHKLKGHSPLALDTETTSLRPFHGGRVFSVIIACSDQEAYYFNFNEAQSGECLSSEHKLRLIRELFSDASKTWYMHNARFDLHMLSEGFGVGGPIHFPGEVYCTQSGAVLENNTHLTYNLADCAKRIGLSKSDAVEDYISEHGLFEWISVPGKKARKKDKFFARVPLDVIAPYALQDAKVTFALGEHQRKVFEALDADTPASVPSVRNVLRNERDLLKTVACMERVGLQIDRDYCLRAARYEAGRACEFAAEYRRLTGRDFKDSGSDFKDIFKSEREKWGITEKGNPSFESDILRTFENPAARCILGHRDAKSRSDFYQGYLYHADEDDVVHPNLNPSGAPATGRFSSSDPNFQNLTAEAWGICRACKKEIESVADSCKCGSTDLELPEFLVRRAIVPRPGYVFIMPDYSQMEYVMMFDYACRVVGYETDVVKRMKAGFDPHQAMADTVTAAGFPLTRSRAKNGNFANLYGSGDRTFAETVGCSLDEARRIRIAMDRGAPEVSRLVGEIMNTARKRKYIINWLGRRSQFPDPRWAYKAPNYLIQGGAADVVKVAMNRIDAMLKDQKSRMILTVHDELLIEVHESEIESVPKRVKEIMESIFPWKYLPLQASMEWSAKSFADKVKGYPGGGSGEKLSS